MASAQPQLLVPASQISGTLPPSQIPLDGTDRIDDTQLGSQAVNINSLKRILQFEDPYIDPPAAIVAAPRLIDEMYPDIFDSDIEQTRRKFLTAHRQGIFKLFDALVDENRNNDLQRSKYFEGITNPTRRSKPNSFITTTTLLILAVLPSRIIEGMILGNLTRVLKTPGNRNLIPDINNAVGPIGKGTTGTGHVKMLNPDEENRPAIYVQILADADGFAPTKSELLRLIQQLELFLEPCGDYLNPIRPPNIQISAASNNLARNVDTVEPAATPSSGPRYDPTKSTAGARKYIKSLEHYRTIIKTMIQWKYALSRIPQGNDDDPLPWSIYEVGWSVQPRKRAADHRSHTKSVEFMNLMDALARITFPSRPKRFRIHQEVVLEVWGPEYAGLAEHTISMLCLSYTRFGGFNTVTAGYSVQSAFDLKSWVWEFWANENKTNLAAARQRVEVEQRTLLRLEETAKQVHDAGIAKDSALALHQELFKLQEDSDDQVKIIRKAQEDVLPDVKKWQGYVEEFVEVLREEGKDNKRLEESIEAIRAFNIDVTPMRLQAEEECRARGEEIPWEEEA